MNRKDNTPYSAQMGIAAIGLWMRQAGIWEVVEQAVKIKQKQRQYTPLEKLLDAFINILTGAERMVELNKRVRGDVGLQRAFGRQGCAEQSVVSTTLNRCTVENIEEMQGALATILRAHSQVGSHNYQQWLLLDVDMCGFVTGAQAEGATKGYFPRQKGKRGRQLGRVTASQYEEIVYQKLYNGKRQLDNSLQELLLAAAAVLELDEERRQRTIVRVDGGGGRDEDINWMLRHGYGVLAKVHSWQRCRKLAKTVTTWLPDEKEAGREAGWVTAPHPYERETKQVAVRKCKANGMWQESLIVTSLPAPVLFWLAGLPACAHPTADQLLWAIVYAYDKRSGGIESSFRQSKEGLHIHRRNKRSFVAQEMLLLLAQLAQNVLIWVRNRLARLVPAWQHWGLKRLLRDVLALPGRLRLDARGRIVCFVVDCRPPNAATLTRAAAFGLLPDDLSLYLCQI